MKRTVLTIVIALVAAAFATTVPAQKIAVGDRIEMPTPSNSIVGSWYVSSTPDGGPPPFKGMISFSEGGAMIASAQGDILQNAGSLATAGHGAWARTGNREFVFTFRQILYNADGDYDGGVVIRHNSILTKDGKSWEGRLTVEFYNSSDELVFTGTGGSTATRIVAESL